MAGYIVNTYAISLIVTRVSLSVNGGPEKVHRDRVEQIIKYFLSREEYLSEPRIHKLIYLTELELIRKGDPLGIDFKPFIDDIYSDDIQEILSNLNDVDKETVRIRGKKVNKFIGNSEPNNIGDTDRRIASQIYDEYGSLSSKELMEAVRDTEPFSDTKFGENMGLSSQSHKDQKKYNLFDINI